MRAIAIPTGLVAAILVCSALLAGHAWAQSGSTSTAGQSNQLPQAPVGHRQPRAQDLPTDTAPSASDEAIRRADQGVDKALNSICKGC